MPASSPAGAQKCLGVLIIIVIVFLVKPIAHGRGDDLAGREAWPIVNRHDAEGIHLHLLAGRERVLGIDRPADDDRIESVDLLQFLLPA